MNTIKKLINKTSNIIVIQGVELHPNVYHDIPENEINNYLVDEYLMKKIVDKEIYVNDGVKDIDDATKAWKWLTGNQIPPSSNEGYWKNVFVDSSDLSENNKFNFSFDVIIDSNTSYTEIINLVQNKNLYIYDVNFLSTITPALLTIEYIRIINNENYRINCCLPETKYFYDFIVNGDFPINSKIIDVTKNNLKQEIYFKTNTTYCFEQNNTKYYEKIENYNKTTGKITFKNNLPVSLSNGTKISNVDQPILSIFSEKSNKNVFFKASLKIEGRSDSFLQIKISNLSKKDFTQCGLIINGYYEL
jgi:hypothetical protein